MTSQARAGWENGQRVPARDGREDYAEEENYSRGANYSVEAMLRKFVYVQLHSERSLFAECFALALSICYDGNSMSEIGKRHNVTRAAISKRCIEICETFGLPPSRAMRSVENREKCRKARLRSRASIR